MTKQEKVSFVINTLQNLYPEIPIPLDHKDPYTLLIAVLLSAQCTDVRVNQITPLLFAKADNPYDMIKMTVEEIKEIIARKTLLEFPNAKVVGLMGMASNSDDEDKVRGEFKGLRKLFDLANELGCDFKVLSMGMSGDYNIAIEEGSNMVRVGSKIFGHRNY